MSESLPSQGETDISSTPKGKELPEGVYKNPEWLRARYWDDLMSAREIAGLVGRNKQTILNHLRKNDIEIRDKGQSREGLISSNANDLLSDKEWLESAYWDDEKSASEIAKIANVTSRPVFYWMERFGIPRRDVSEATPSGEDHYRWKGGVGEYYGSEWPSISEAIRERDNYECQICGDGQDELESDMSLDVHHIIPYELFDKHSEAHDEDNLISLCRSCHRQWEGIPLRPVVE